MTLYGDLDEVERMLRPTETTVYGADLRARLEPIQRVISSLIDLKTGRRFGEAPAEQARIVWAGSSHVLLLDPPARSITKIETGGTWNGTTLVSPYLLDAQYYRADAVDDNGLIWAVHLGTWGTWGYYDVYGNPSTPVLITGHWADQSDSLAIPDDIEYIANYLIAGKYRRDRTSAAAEIGPDGNVTAVPDPWKDETVKSVIAKYSLVATPRLA